MLTLTSFATAAAGEAPTNESRTVLVCPMVGDAAIIRLLQPIRARYNLPALAALVLTGDRIVAVGEVGVLIQWRTQAASKPAPKSESAR